MDVFNIDGTILYNAFITFKSETNYNNKSK